LYGILHTGQKITFHIWNNPSWIDGFQSFEVLWFVVYSGELVSAFSGLRIYGSEVDDYFPPSKAFRHTILKEADIRQVSASSEIYAQEWGNVSLMGIQQR